MMPSAVQCNPVQCNEVQCSVVQCSAMKCSVVQCSAVQCGIYHRRVTALAMGRLGGRRLLKSREWLESITPLQCTVRNLLNRKWPRYSGAFWLGSTFTLMVRSIGPKSRYDGPLLDPEKQ